MLWHNLSSSLLSVGIERGFESPLWKMENLDYMTTMKEESKLYNK